MKSTAITTIRNTNELSIADPSFSAGSPYRYELSLADGDYSIAAFGEGETEEIRIINTAVDPEGLEWIDLADDIFVRSGRLAITAKGNDRQPAQVLIGTRRKCCARISCIEKNMKVQGIRIGF